MPGRRRWRRRFAWAGLALLLSAAFVGYQPVWAFGLLERAAPGIVWRVTVSEPLVALTFDDGPSPTHTPAVLRVLENHGARATFFLIGPRAQGQEKLLARMKASGHELGNHYLTKRSVLHLSEAEFQDGLERTQRLLAPHGAVRLFRPPGGLIRPGQLHLARNLGYQIVLGSAFPYDGRRAPPARYMKWLVGKNLAPGAIVILHDGVEDPARMIEALDGILAEGTARGCRFVPVGELLHARPAKN